MGLGFAYTHGNLSVMKNKNILNLKHAVKALCFIAFTLVMSAKCYSQTSSENDSKLTASDLSNISSFKASVGLNRIALFEQIKPLVKCIDANGSTSEATTSEELISLLGEPDVKIQQSIYQYNLNVSSNSCKAIVGLSKDGMVTFCVIKDCQ